MTGRRNLLRGLAIVGLAGAVSAALAANDPTALDPQNETPGGILRPLAEPPARTSEALPRGNPLWSMPLSSLHFTRERPLFVPSRRPPAPAVVAARPAPQPPPPPPPEQLTLSLVGIVTGVNEGIAIFTDNTTHDIVRLRTGEGHRGWILRSVAGREAVFEKGNQTIAVALPAINGEQK